MNIFSKFKLWCNNGCIVGKDECIKECYQSTAVISVLSCEKWLKKVICEVFYKRIFGQVRCCIFQGKLNRLKNPGRSGIRCGLVRSFLFNIFNTFYKYLIWKNSKSKSELCFRSRFDLTAATSAVVAYNKLTQLIKLFENLIC